MAVDEKNPGRWELVKVYRILLCWLLVSTSSLAEPLPRHAIATYMLCTYYPSTQDEYAAVYVVSYGNGRTKLCAQEDLRSLNSLLRTNGQKAYCPISKP